MKKRCPNGNPSPESEGTPIRYSIVIPMRDEEGNVEPLWREVTEVMGALGEPYELIFIDDGSADRTYERLLSLYERDPHVHVLRFSKNFGQTPALMAGFDFARGEIIIAMDGDLQYDARDIPRLVRKLGEGYDLVSGWRAKRSDAWLTRRLPSRVANWLVARLSGIPLRDFGSTFKAYRREVVAELRLYGEQHRFIPVLAAQWWNRLSEIPVNVRPRQWGRSKYGLSRTLRVAFDLMTIAFLQRYLAQPLRLFGGWGVIALLIGLGLDGYLLEEKFLRRVSIMGEHGPLLLLSTLLIITGVQFISLGLLGEIISRTYYESRRKQIYSIRQIHSRRSDLALPVETSPQIRERRFPP